MPINPADILAIDRSYAFAVDDAHPLGAEGVGIVEAIGEKVNDLEPGDMVLPSNRGNWCAVRLVERSALISLPCGIDPAHAAMLRINPPTAWLLLDALGVEAGDVIVQNAGGSAVAGWVRAFGRSREIRVVDVVRRFDPAVPDALIDGPDLADRVRADIAEPIRGALDCVAGEATGRLAACLEAGARVMLFGHLSRAPISVASSLLTGRGLTIAGFSLRPAEAALDANSLRRLRSDVLAMLPSVPHLPVRAVFSLAEADRAIAQARSGERGRIHLRP